MKVDNPNFDKQELIHLLRGAYAIEVTHLEFVPKGEESYGYIATTSTENSYFIKVHQSSVSPELVACYRFVYHLRHNEGCQWVVSPYPTLKGEFLAPLGNYAVVVLDFVAGATKLPSDLSEAQQVRFAGQLAKLHNSAPLALSSDLPKETFAISFRSWLLDVLEAVAKPLKTTHARAQGAYELLRTEKPRILALLEEIEQIAALLESADQWQCVTHGDLASNNIIQAEDDSLFLIDWGKLSVAPAARDLVTLWGAGNAPLLSTYFQQVGNISASSTFLDTFSEEVLTYYFYYNLLATITDYGSWLILEDASAEEAENAWLALSQALPLDLQKVHMTVKQFMAYMIGAT